MDHQTIRLIGICIIGGVFSLGGLIMIITSTIKGDRKHWLELYSESVYMRLDYERRKAENNERK